MKVKFRLDSGANIYSVNDTGWLDTVDDLGLEEGEWESMTEEQKEKIEDEYWECLGLPELTREEKEY